MRTIFLVRILAGCEGRLDSLQATTGVGYDVFDEFHRNVHDRQSGSPLQQTFAPWKTPFLLRLILKGGGASHKERYQLYGVALGLKAPVLRAFRYYKGR